MITTRNGTRYLAIRPTGETVEVPITAPLKPGWQFATESLAPASATATPAEPGDVVPPTPTGATGDADLDGRDEQEP